MEQFILASSPGLNIFSGQIPDPCVTVTFHTRTYDKEGHFEYYHVDLDGPGLHASFRVDHLYSPNSPADLFRKTAVNWRGWKGVERWRAYEGEFDIKAEHSPRGRVSFECRKQEYTTPADWSASVWIVVEAGQLERLAREAEAFFDSKR